MKYKEITEGLDNLARHIKTYEGEQDWLNTAYTVAPYLAAFINHPESKSLTTSPTMDDIDVFEELKKRLKARGIQCYP